MQPDQIMSHVIELELLNRWDDLFAIVALMKDTESKYENRIVTVQPLHSVITAFININDEVTVSRVGVLRLYAFKNLAHLAPIFKTRKLHNVTRDWDANRY